MVLLLAGCAYHEYRRVYTFEPRPSADQRTAVASAVERYFLDRGYVLKQKFRSHSPTGSLVSVLEIPKTSERKVLRAELFISAADDGAIELTYEEWFWKSNPFAAGSHAPSDVLGATRADLIAHLKQQLGVSLDLKFSRRSYY